MQKIYGLNKKLYQLLSLLLALTACSNGLPEPTPTIIPQILNPEMVIQDLTSVQTLQEAAEQLAHVTDTPVDRIRVRLRSTECMLCDKADQAPDFDGLSVNEAVEQIKTSDAAWLLVHNLSCFYQIEQEQLVPYKCAERD